MSEPYLHALALLASGTPAQWDELADRVPGFPHGVDDVVRSRWIINAIGGGSKACVEWMLERKVDLDFRESDGYTPLHAALERDPPDRHALLELLLRAGAPVNRKGLNDWTPAHMAAAMDDVESLKILVRHGADLSIGTDIDDYATPLEEARNLGKLRAAEYLAGVSGLQRDGGSG
jgi:ankyrin repeat protein